MQLAAENNLLIIFGSELRGDAIDALVAFGKQKARFICLADYSNSRGAADMGLFPDLLPGYHSVSGASRSQLGWAAAVSTTPGLALPEMLDAARCRATAGALRRRLQSRRALRHEQLGLQQTFPRRAGHVPHRDRAARRRLPARGLRLREGRHRHQHLRRPAAAEEGRRRARGQDRLRDRSCASRRRWAPIFASWCPSGARRYADMGQTRGAQSGEADRNAVLAESRGLASRTSPLDPTLTLDEIAALVPGYSIRRVDLASGTPQRTTLVQIEADGDSKPSGADRAGRTMACSPPARWAATRRR